MHVCLFVRRHVCNHACMPWYVMLCSVMQFNVYSAMVRYELMSYYVMLLCYVSSLLPRHIVHVCTCIGECVCMDVCM